MKTTLSRSPWQNLPRLSFALHARVAAVSSALLLAVAPLMATVTVSTLSGGPTAINAYPYGYVDGDTDSGAQFHTPIGLALDSTGDFMFVADRDNNVVRMLDLVGNQTFTFATDSVNQPVGVVLDSEDNLYVLNAGNGRNGTVLEFDYYGDLIATNAAQLTNASGMAIDPAGNIYVTVASNKLVQISSGAVNVTPSAANTTVINYNYPANTNLNNAKTCLQGIVVRDDGLVAACDSGNNGIVIINPTNGVISLLTGFNGVGDYTGVNNRGAKTNTAKFNQPTGLAKAGNNILIVSDYGNNRVKVVSSAGTVTNLYGVSSSLWYIDSSDPEVFPGWYDGTVMVPDAVGDVEARLPNGILFAVDGTVYVTEDYYSIIRKVTGANLPPIPPPPPPPSLPPAAPTIWTVSTNFGQVSLTWSPVAGTSITYNVKRSPSNSGPFTTIANTAFTSYTDDSVLNGMTYYYVVSAVGPGGESPDSAPKVARVPLPPVPDPQIGYVDFPASSEPVHYTSVFYPVSSSVFNNDTPIVIVGAAGSQTFYTYGPTPASGSIPDPTSASASAPVGYEDGLAPSQVAFYTISQTMPDLTIRAIGEKHDGSPPSAIVQARLQYVTANPIINGDNAAQFTVLDITTNAQMWYTTDGSDPTDAAPSVGPVASGTTLSLQVPAGASNLIFKVIASRTNYQPSAIVPAVFSATNFVPNSISFGFASGEASSVFIASPGQIFYAPVTLSPISDTKILSLQFNLTATNLSSAPPVDAGSFRFMSMLVKPDPNNPGFYTGIPPYMFLSTNPPTGLPPLSVVHTNFYDGTNEAYFEDLTFIDNSIDLMGVGWMERAGEKYLYDTTSQELISYSMAHDTVFSPSIGQVVLGAYGFRVPPNALPGQQYRIQIGLPSATADGMGATGNSVYIAAPTNGSLASGAINSIKLVTAGQRKYIAGDCAPFHWVNAGDFGDTNLDNSDVMQVFQSVAYKLNYPLVGSDFFDSMDSCGGTYTDKGNGYLEFGAPVSGPGAVNPLFDGNDTTINQIAFGDGQLDVCDVYVTFRRSLDPSLVWFRRFWTNGIRAAEIVSNVTPSQQSLAAHDLASQSVTQPPATNSPLVNFASADVRGSAGQTLQIPITATIFGNYPLRVLMLILSVEPLDGSPGLTVPVAFTPNAALGQPTMATSQGAGNYAATWLNSTIAGLTGTATIGTLAVTIPANAPSSAAYAIHFDHASASPNGIASFPNKTLTGLVTLADRSSSSYGDGIPDSWRLRYFGTVNNLLSQASADADGDGVNNLQEYLAGTDPTDASSFLNVATHQAMAQQSQDCVIHWPTVAGKQYVIERSANLFGSNWVPVSTNTGSGTDMEIHDATGGSIRFYRVRVAQ